MTNRPALTPGALRDAPALIELVFPAQKVSYEAQRERKANLYQTLTGLGSYWKGRKPLILVRAIVLGTLLPPTGDAERDLDIFEKLMAFDEEGLARRALANEGLKPHEIAKRVHLADPWNFFTARVQGEEVSEGDLAYWTFPLNCEERGVVLRWRRDLSDGEKLAIYRQAIATYDGYEEKADLGKRPEEMNQAWLYAPIWHSVNRHYGHLGIHATDVAELVAQLGMLRYGHRARVGDTFSGGGSIPFEAARIGCDAFASDLNPIACMLTWGAFNIVGASAERRAEIERTEHEAAASVQAAIASLGIEHDADGNQAKVYLYCLETRCPETGWLVPLSPSWVISKNGNVIAKLEPDYANRRFEIRVVPGATAAEMQAASKGTVQDGSLQYELDGKTYRVPIRTLRGDYRDAKGATQNRLRRWEQFDFKPAPQDVFQERLYVIQWIDGKTLKSPRPRTYFEAPTPDDLAREVRVDAIVAANLAQWQRDGFVPDMVIEPGDKTDEPIRTRGWTHWHHLFNGRQLLLYAELQKHATPELCLKTCQMINTSARLTRWSTGDGDGRSGGTKQVFDNQALNVLFNYGCRASSCLLDPLEGENAGSPVAAGVNVTLKCHPADELADDCDIFITDPPYADAVNYHEITEFFIAWLRRNPPAPFDGWVWDSRRALAIQGAGEEFRRGMVNTYKAMADHMPDNGMQCVMFTYQDKGTTVWPDMVAVFWAAGLQVVASWYIATETTSKLKQGGYVQGTVILMLKKRAAGERTAFKQRLLPAVRQEVARQIETMMHLNDSVKSHHGEPVFNDSDLQMAGYAAALKVLTGYTHIGGEDVTAFALRPRVKGEVTVVDEIVQQAAEAASNLLVPEGLLTDTWGKLTGIERFMLRMMDMETTGARKLDNYQNFAKAFRLEDYSRVMASMEPNSARLKRVPEFASRDLTDSTELGASRLGRLIIALQQLRADVEPQTIISQLQAEMPDFLEARPLLMDLVAFVERKAPEPEVRAAAEVLGARLRNQRFGA
jgi:putative DNA methylase